MTNVLEKRLAQHTAGAGARYTRGRAPLLLLQSWPVETKSAALKLERKFKKLRKIRKEAILKLGLQDWMIPAPAPATVQ